MTDKTDDTQPIELRFSIFVIALKNDENNKLLNEREDKIVK